MYDVAAKDGTNDKSIDLKFESPLNLLIIERLFAIILSKLLLCGEDVRVDMVAADQESLYLPNSCTETYKQLAEMCFGGSVTAPIVTSFSRSISKSLHVSTPPTRGEVEHNLNLTRSGEWIDVVHGIVGLASINPSLFSSLVLASFKSSPLDAVAADELKEKISLKQLLTDLQFKSLLQGSVELMGQYANVLRELKQWNHSHFIPLLSSLQSNSLGHSLMVEILGEMNVHHRGNLLPFILAAMGDASPSEELSDLVGSFLHSDNKNAQVAAISNLIKWEGKGSIPLSRLALAIIIADKDGSVDPNYLAVLVQRLKFAEMTEKLRIAIMGLLEHKSEKVRIAAGQTISELLQPNT